MPDWPRRAKAVIREILAGHMPRGWVSDRYGAQQGHGADWQVCPAHVLRDIQYALDASDDPFARRLKRLILRALAIGRRRPDLKDASLRQTTGIVLLHREIPLRYQMIQLNCPL